MAYKCRCCGSNTVENDGDICELCAIGNDPYMNAMNGGQQGGNQAGFGSGSGNGSFAGNNTSYGTAGKGKRTILIGGGASTTKTDPYGNSIDPAFDNGNNSQPVQVYGAGQTPLVQTGGTSTVISTNGNNGNLTNVNTKSNPSKGSALPVSEGISKNITVDHQEKSTLEKLMRTMFQGVPYPLDDDVTMFQVYPDYTGTALNALGYACDQIIVYGKVNAGAIAENNDVAVYGHRDKHNNVIASKIVNRASGTSIVPDRVISFGVIWGLVIAVLATVLFTAAALGANGIAWVIVIILCLTNLPLVIKIIGAIIGIFFSMIKKLF